MRSVALVALLGLALLAGCCPTSIALDSRWQPLLEVKANDATESGVFQTNGSTCYTHSTCDFIELGSEEQNGLLLHEQLHSSRQFAYPGGPTAYLERYDRDIDFKMSEELDGWRLELLYDRDHGVTIDVDLVATFMSTHYLQGPTEANPGRPGIGLAEAQAWIVGVLASK